MSSPALVVCGPQTSLPSTQYLTRVQQGLVGNPKLAGFVDAINDLPRTWNTLIKTDDRLQAASGQETIEVLQQFVQQGRFHKTPETSNNTLFSSLTVIFEIAEYFNFLASDNSHAQVLKTAGSAGIQGFCTGFLAAAALACSKDEDEIIRNASVALRLAFAVGAFVDLNATSGNVACLTARWRDNNDEHHVAEILKHYPEAYVSVVPDTKSVTITTSKATVAALSQSLTARGLFSKTIELEGLYHTPALTEALEKLLALSASDTGLQFGNAPLVPLRSNIDGQIIGQSSLQHTALEVLLTKVSRWDTTLLNALIDMTDHDHKTVLTLGPMDSVPALTLRELGADIIIASGSKTLITGCLQSNFITPGPNIPGVVEAPEHQYPAHAVAIVGMGCRFPGADSVEEFWELLSAGTSMVRNIPPERFLTKELRRTPKLGPENFWGNFLSDPDAFDHKFFKKSSREAQQMDPQQRLLLEVAYEAILSSGYFGEIPNDSQADTGVFLGIGATDYGDNVGSHPPNAFSAVGTLRAFLSGKLSHYFGWHGPSITYDTACSSSAVALHSACRAIASGECSRALAGGANVITSPNLHQNLAAASFLSPTGATKAFDAKADGYCRGEGVGLVVLKRLSDAIAEGDKLLGVIAGSAVNQNSNESSITVPHSPSQVQLYKKAAALAEIKTRDVSFVEAHGTGTPVGDPIEYESIKDAFGGPQRDSKLYLGSVKANVGHCEAASGIAALIKVILMLQHGQIPVQANFSKLNPNIKSSESDLIEIPRKTQTWDTNFRAACINNYGAAGSNGTLIVCQAPTVSNPRRTVAVAPRYPIFISAHSEPSLKSYCGLLSDVAAKNDLADVAFNLADKESRFLPQNLVTTAATAGELQGKLLAKKLQSPVSKAKPLILAFSGQTSNVIGLSKEVYYGSTIFQRHLDQCDSVLRSIGLPSLYPGVFSAEPIDDLVSLHTKLFAFQYANAMSWIDCGLHIDAVMGHSFGQLTALCVSGSLSLVDVIKLVAGRAALMQNFWGPERGAMIHMDADVATVNKLIASNHALDPPHHVSVACFNGPSSQVLVGRESSINKIEHTLTDPHQFAGTIKFQRLTTTHGFHSEFTEPILGRLSELAEQLDFKSPSIPLETCTEGQSWSKIEPRCISEHTRQPVYFEEAVRRLSDRYGPCTWLGVGPSSAIIKMVGRAQGKSISPSHSMLPVRLDRPDSLGVLADVTANLWTLGHRVQYWPFHRCQKASYTPITLPPYQFENSRHWLEYVDTTSSKIPETAPTHSAAEPVTLISLAHDRSKTAREAVFKVDQRSEEFKILTTGHAVVGNPLCPMSLYVELASRAALIMRPNSDQVANVENLEIRSPLGMSTERSITLTIRQAAGDGAVWTFNIESQRITPDGKAATIISHASGKIRSQAPTHQGLLNDFSRFERLVDHRLYKALTTDSSAESMQGAVIYKMFDLVVHYADYYHGVKSISSKDNRVAGRVSMPPNQKALHETTTHPLAVDNFLQVAGLHVNSLSDCGPNEVFVATQIDEIQPGPLFNQKGDVAQSWDVFSSFSRSGGKEVINDIFVFDPVDQRLLMIILGAHFTKVSTLSLVKALATVNSNQPTSAPRVANSATPLRPKAEREEIEATVPTPVESTKHIQSVQIANDVLHVLNKVADVPIEEGSKDATFEDLGIDSLMINEVLSGLRDFFAIDIPMAEFQSLQDCRSLCAYLEGKCARSTDSVSSDTSTTDTPLASSNASSVDPADLADAMETQDSEVSDVSGRLSNVIAEHLEVPMESLTNESNLADLGLDSLLGMEIISDIAEKLQVTITAADLTPETTFGGLAAVLAERIGCSHSTAAKEQRTVAPVPSTVANSGTTPTSRQTNPDAIPSVENAAQTFLQNSKYAYDPFARQLGFADFWTKVYPTETRLVVRYVVDAFEYLGCPITSLVAGQEVAVKRSLAKWWLERDMGQLYNILYESGIVVKEGDRFVRTNTTIESTSASKLLREVIEKFPQHVVEHELLDITGSQLGPCLCGDKDPLKLLFGNKATRDLLTDFYTNAPLFLAGTMVLAEFLSSVYKAKKGSGPVRILELGAGTGGTTKYIVEHLLKEGIEFEYTFTDLSSSLVATARKRFKSWGFMNFKVLDIEKTLADQFLARYHTVLSTNCIHATRDLTVSLSNIRKTLLPDGFVSLVELTRNIPWYDLVFGLVEGWWLFNDGRAHALSGPDNWERNMKAAGFTSANWTEGSPEAGTLRVVAGFQGEVPAVAGKEVELKPVSTSKKPSVETVTYKESDGLELKADVYYPAESSVSSDSRPIALMIHGGGHVMLSRKDVRRKQTQLLLDNGFLPISIDYRLCPEVPITSGPMTDVCDALHWCRTTLPTLRLKDNIAVDPEKVVVVGWSTGGHLSMTLAFTAIQRGIRPPTAIFALYCPTDYEDPCWQSPNYPGSDAYPELQHMSKSESYDLLEGVYTSPLLAYNVPPARRALGGWLDTQDPRSRIALHMNWTGQALPILLHGLPAKSLLPPHIDPQTYHSLPQPPQQEIQSISPLAQVKKGTYRTPTFLVHSTEDDLIPWQQSRRFIEALGEAGVECGIRCPEELPHLFDITPGCDGDGKGWEAILEGYRFLVKAVWIE